MIPLKRYGLGLAMAVFIFLCTASVVWSAETVVPPSTNPANHAIFPAKGQDTIAFILLVSLVVDAMITALGMFVVKWAGELATFMVKSVCVRPAYRSRINPADSLSQLHYRNSTESRLIYD